MRGVRERAVLLVTRQPLERALSGIEWPTLFFFIGLSDRLPRLALVR